MVIEIGRKIVLLIVPALRFRDFWTAIHSSLVINTASPLIKIDIGRDLMNGILMTIRMIGKLAFKAPASQGFTCDFSTPNIIYSHTHVIRYMF